MNQLSLGRERFGDYEREPGGDKEYGYVVVRQKTSGPGYHTTDADVRRLYAMVKVSPLMLAILAPAELAIECVSLIPA